MICIENLKISSGSHTIIRNLSLQLKAGETLTILGQTGAGKSLLAQAIIGDLPEGIEVSGAVFLNGVEMLSASSEVCRQIWGRQVSMLPQEPWRSLSPLMSISRQVAEVLRYGRQFSRLAAKKKSHEHLSALRLGSDLDKVPSQISGGMAQRAAFACIRATEATLWLADEPTKGLDAANKRIVVAELMNHAQTGGLLTITHDIDVARQLGGRLCVLKDGVLVEAGDAGKVLNSPDSNYLRDLINASPEYWPDVALNEHPFPALATLHNFTLVRGRKTLVKNLDLRLGSGEIIGLFGDSGCGKTSLGDALLGLLPYRGGITFHQPIKRHQTLKLYQDPPSAFAPHIPLRTLLDDVVRLHSLDPTLIDSLAMQLELDPLILERIPKDVSGGELQRIALLRALLLQPKLLVADEPTSRLDPITSQRITELLVSKCREMGCTVLLISHEQKQLEKVCDRVFHMGGQKFGRSG